MILASGDAHVAGGVHYSCEHKSPLLLLHCGAGMPCHYHHLCLYHIVSGRAMC